MSASNGTPVSIAIQDGTKVIAIRIHEYFLSTDDAVATQFVYQSDFKSAERVISVSGKGSDYYVYLDGRLIIDGTGKLTTASAVNSLIFGDVSITAADNSDVVWSYFNYYNTALVFPEFTSGSLSESIEFSGNRESVLTSLWNNASPVAAKSYLGINKNYVGEGVIQKETRRDITINPTTTSTAAVLVPELECYVMGADINSNINSTLSNSTAGQSTFLDIYYDGSSGTSSQVGFTSGTVNQVATASLTTPKRMLVGLHKVDCRYNVTANTGTAGDRNFNVEVRS